MSDFLAFLNDYPLLFALFIILARIADVTLGTVRTITVVRGYRTAAAILGFFEVVVWVTAVSGVLTDITLLKFVAYALGFALGNATGVMIERRLAIGKQVGFILSRHPSASVAFALRLAGYRVTEIAAQGKSSPVALCMVVVQRRKMPEVFRLAKDADEHAIIFTEDVRDSSLVLEPGPTLRGRLTGWRAIMKKK